jgi:hypothetical protein
MEELAFGAPCREDFGWVLGRVPKPNEQVEFADFALPAVGKTDLIIDESIVVFEIVGDPADMDAFALAHIHAGLWAQICSADFVKR